ncbi:energy transducer TonB [Thiobacillus sp.]|uniref:energy transducer TonB n=1 Tax=Thiobacillus sp. TaxID=924 RepID=UPI0025D60442|nr:energy transducer TonB [Thiobacillus sp.]
MDWNRAVGLLVVLALHGGVLYALWSARVIPPPAEAVTLFVNFINPPPQPAPRVIPAPPPPKPVKQAPPPKPVKPPHYHLAAQAPVASPQEAVEPLPPPEPVVEPPPVVAAPAPVQAPSLPAPPPKPAGPVTLAAELAVSCPERRPPVYPPMSRRLGETGKVVLRVELDETGRVSTAQVASSSGSARLDAAALAAVKSWRCTPAQRDGQAVRSVATQPFNFTLEGR